MRGYNVYPRTVSSAKGIREDAGRAYYWPFNIRSNLEMLANIIHR